MDTLGRVMLSTVEWLSGGKKIGKFNIDVSKGVLYMEVIVSFIR